MYHWGVHIATVHFAGTQTQPVEQRIAAFRFMALVEPFIPPTCWRAFEEGSKVRAHHLMADFPDYPSAGISTLQCSDHLPVVVEQAALVCSGYRLVQTTGSCPGER